MTCLRLSALLLASAAVLPGQQPPPPYTPKPEELVQIRAKLANFDEVRRNLDGKPDPALLADADIYRKAAAWLLRFPEEFYKPDYVAQALSCLDRGLARLKELQTGKSTWATQTGRFSLAYRSRVDGSLQPYGIVIPPAYDRTKPIRLDVILHGRAANMTEASFLYAHDQMKPIPPAQDYLELEVFGRTNNAYRWAGETDVYEALADVQRRYRIDPQRIVLRGFSMGGAGTWHIGLHDPCRWAAIEAGAGFTETKLYAKQTQLPPAVEATLHIYDALDYALNAVNVPTVGYGGEIDPQRQASINIREALVKEGYQFTPDGLNWVTKDLAALFLVGPKTEHKFHPDSKRLSEEFINRALAQGPRLGERTQFVTYTPRYGQCGDFTIDSLDRQYERAELLMKRTAPGAQVEITTKNISRLLLSNASGTQAILIDGSKLRPSKTTTLAFAKGPRGWQATQPNEPNLSKRRGLQGPIDDAFMDSFLVVRPTGQARHPEIAKQTQSRLARFEQEFAKYFRGEIRIKDDTAINASDIATHHLVLFGDPQSNRLLAKMLPKLPLQWTKEAITLAGQTFPADTHLPVLIYPNPLNPGKYIVLNTGHTFHSEHLRGTNALLFPRLGDYAVLKLEPGSLADTPVLIGLMDSSWQVPHP